MSLRLSPLDRQPATREAACALLARALPYDCIERVLDEKLFGDNGARKGHTVGAYLDETLVGVLAQAGRFIKLLAVEPAFRRRGVGVALLDHAIDHAVVTAQAAAPASAGGHPHTRPLIRIADHPGNYLSPGVDERYVEGIAFLTKRGFVERGRVENLCVPYADNPLVSAARAEALCADAAKLGYRIVRPDASELPGLLEMIGREFAPVWAKEAERAAQGPRAALFAAFTVEGAPIAFAAADGNNQGLGWFGPAGTLPAHRGKRLGEALLLQCLIAVEGLPEAGVIAWIGPKAFYERAAGAHDDRRFLQLERPA